MSKPLGLIVYCYIAVVRPAVCITMVGMGGVAGHSGRAATERAGVRVLLAIAVLASLGVQGWLIFVQEFNWDEFYYLALVYEYLRGELDKALQTIHVRLFAPLAWLPRTEVDQLIAGRLCMLALQVASFVSLYLLARTWVSPAPALFALLGYATMATTLQHGSSFRADPFALALLLAALALFARAPLRHPAITAVGLLLALAGMVTVKSIFFAPAFVAVAVWRLRVDNSSRAALVGIGSVGVLAAVSFALLYLLHDMALPAAELSRSEALLGSAGRTTLLDAGFLPRRGYIQHAIATSPVQFLLIVASMVGLCIAAVRRRHQERWESIAILGCVLPLASLLFYRNAFPYFFPFITAPAFVAVAWLAHQRQWNGIVLGTLAAAMVATASLSLPRVVARDQAAQRAVIAAVHELFPGPVPYIDRSSMIASFPKEGFFMSTWGMLEYRKRAPVFAQLLEAKTIPLLLVNGPALEQALQPRQQTRSHLALHPHDEEVLRSNYVQHWGPIWVAGKHVNLRGGADSMTIIVPGTYTVEGAPVILGGRQLQPGDAVALDRASYRVAGSPGAEAILRWGNHLEKPSRPAPREPLFKGF